MKMLHPEFATWYSAVDFGESPSRIEARSNAISTILRRFNFERAIDLVDVMLAERAGLEGDGASIVRAACTEADPTFPVSGNEREISVLAEIALAIAINQKKENALSGRVAELIFSALANGIRDFCGVTDILNRARDIVQHQGRLLRRRPRLPKKPRSYMQTLNFQSSFSDVQNLGDINQAKLFMDSVSKTISIGIRNVANVARTEREALEHHIKLQDEELDLLWWATNGYSATVQALFGDMQPGVRAFIAAFEAANRTICQPGPCSILGLFEKVGVVADTEMSFQAYFAEIDTELLLSLRIQDVRVRTPLHLGIQMKHESSDSQTWLSHWSSRTGIDAHTKRSEVTIAELVYRERLVLGAFGDQQ